MNRVRKPSETPCTSCGAEGYEIDYRPETVEELARRGICLNCLHWLEVVEARSLHCVIDGFAYRPKADDPDLRRRTGGWGLGGGGTEHRIVLEDGTLLRCNNMWHRGEVPDLFRDRLPDDARFATAEERESLHWDAAITHLPREH